MNVAHPHSSLIGMTLGEYELSASLGGGPHGHVFLARHLDGDSTCAVKVFDSRRCSPEGLQRHLAVSAAAAAIPAARACPIYTSHLEGPHPFIALEPIHGRDRLSCRARSPRANE